MKNILFCLLIFCVILPKVIRQEPPQSSRNDVSLGLTLTVKMQLKPKSQPYQDLEQIKPQRRIDRARATRACR